MPIKEFWNEDPDLLWAYRKSYMDKMKIQSEIDNYNAWLSGVYIYDAISKTIYNNFGRKETQPILNYVEKPFDFSKVKSKEELEKERIKKIEDEIKEQTRKLKEKLKK